MSLCLCVMCVVIVEVVHWSARPLVPGTEGYLVLFGMCLKSDVEQGFSTF